jgi:hypothetical protein
MSSTLENLVNLYTVSNKDNIVRDLINKNLEILKLLSYLETPTKQVNKKKKKTKRVVNKVKSDNKDDSFIPPSELLENYTSQNGY